jgi:hypothetical protein
LSSAISTTQPELLEYATGGKAGTYIVRVFNYTRGSAVANFTLDFNAK